jgi:uncharacterized protein (DUF1330 family)
MKANYKLVLAMLAGVAIGVVASQGLNAQGRPPGYFVFDHEVTDPDGYKRVIELTPASLTPYGGRLLANGGRHEVLQGMPPNRFGIFAFGSLEDARAWFNSARMKEILPIVARTSKPRSFVIEGG